MRPKPIELFWSDPPPDFFQQEKLLLCIFYLLSWYRNQSFGDRDIVCYNFLLFGRAKASAYWETTWLLLLLVHIFFHSSYYIVTDIRLVELKLLLIVGFDWGVRQLSVLSLKLLVIIWSFVYVLCIICHFLVFEFFEFFWFWAFSYRIHGLIDWCFALG